MKVFAPLIEAIVKAVESCGWRGVSLYPTGVTFPIETDRPGSTYIHIPSGLYGRLGSRELRQIEIEPLLCGKAQITGQLVRLAREPRWLFHGCANRLGWEYVSWSDSTKRPTVTEEGPSYLLPPGLYGEQPGSQTVERIPVIGLLEELFRQENCRSFGE